jgi:hypothetical protein
MSWQDFLGNLAPEDPSQGRVLNDKFIGLGAAPDISWYPGSGHDITPLLLDVPGNPTHRRLMRTLREPEEQPLLLWMNDSADMYAEFPDPDILGRECVQQYPELWSQFGSLATLGTAREIYMCGDIKICLFTVTVMNLQNRTQWRGEGGDEYLVCFSHCDSEKLFKKIFVQHRLHVSRIALIKQGGLSGQRRGFDQYVDLPKMVVMHADSVGEVNSWVLDTQGLAGTGVPRAGVLKSHKRIGRPLDWGWSPARIYVSDTVASLREDVAGI